MYLWLHGFHLKSVVALSHVLTDSIFIKFVVADPGFFTVSHVYIPQEWMLVQKFADSVPLIGRFPQTLIDEILKFWGPACRVDRWHLLVDYMFEKLVSAPHLREGWIARRQRISEATKLPHVDLF